MRYLRNSQNWSLLALAGSMVMTFVFCFAPGHRHVFGDWSDPVSALVGLALMIATFVEVAMLFSIRRQTR